MMTKAYRTFLSSGVAACGFLASAVSAQTVDPSTRSGAAGVVTSADADQTQTDTTGVSDLEVVDIVVTARRRGESLQDVPSTVQAISGDTTEKLNITQFQDVAALVPGLTLNTGTVTSGAAPAPSIRGVTYDAGGSPSPTVDIYVNEVPVDAGLAFNLIYDLGNIQVLRGPQGTLRGRTAPSGAILLSTRRADTAKWDGYISMFGTDRGSINGQLALNAPIIDGILGLRVAGAVDQNDGNFVRSAVDGVNPFRNTESGRASLTFTPSGNLEAFLTYQYTHVDTRSFSQVAGNGSPGGPLVTTPVGFNGSMIAASDRLGVDSPRLQVQEYHQVNGSINWNILGHTLSYVGGYYHRDSVVTQPLDYGNLVTNGTFSQNLSSRGDVQSHEVRLASQPGAGKVIDYTVGYFHSYNDGITRVAQPAVFLPGAFGIPSAVASPAAFDTRYTVGLNVVSQGPTKEDSFFGNATLHIGNRTEITGGLRYIISSIESSTVIRLGSGVTAAAIPAPCAALGFGSTYPGFCDVPVTLNTIINSATRNERNNPVVYNASVSHRFSDDLLAYATTGSSWRRGGSNVLGIANGLNDPVLTSLAFVPNETSRSYEVGLKTTLFDRRLRFNIAGFYQTFKNLNFQVPSIPYVEATGRSTILSVASFTAGADAIVKGVDLDATMVVTPNWTVGGTFSYAKGNVDDGLIPCRDANFDGVADAGTPTLADYQSRNLFVTQCRSSQSVSRDPIWSATAQTEVHGPLIGSTEGYLRGLLSYYPKNGRRNPGFTVSNYALLNLYLGLRSSDSGWDVNVFARNLTNAGIELSREPDDVSEVLGARFGSTGYRLVSYTPPREIGISARYSFGSR